MKFFFCYKKPKVILRIADKKGELLKVIDKNINIFTYMMGLNRKMQAFIKNSDSKIEKTLHIKHIIKFIFYITFIYKRT